MTDTARSSSAEVRKSVPSLLSAAALTVDDAAATASPAAAVAAALAVDDAAATASPAAAVAVALAADDAAATAPAARVVVAAAPAAASAADSAAKKASPYATELAVERVLEATPDVVSSMEEPHGLHSGRPHPTLLDALSASAPDLASPSDTSASNRASVASPP